MQRLLLNASASSVVLRDLEPSTRYRVNVACATQNAGPGASAEPVLLGTFATRLFFTPASASSPATPHTAPASAAAPRLRSPSNADADADPNAYGPYAALSTPAPAPAPASEAEDALLSTTLPTPGRHPQAQPQPQPQQPDVGAQSGSNAPAPQPEPQSPPAPSPGAAAGVRPGPGTGTGTGTGTNGGSGGDALASLELPRIVAITPSATGFVLTWQPPTSVSSRIVSHYKIGFGEEDIFSHEERFTVAF